MAGPWEKYAAPAAAAPAEDGPWAKYKPAAAPATEPAPAEQPSFGQMLKAEVMTGPAGGFARGLKDIVDTGAYFAAKGYDKLTGGDAQTLSGLVTGERPGEAARIQAMNEAGKADFKAAQDMAGAGTSDAFRIGGNIAATAPVGGVLAAPFQVAARSVPILQPFANALASSGMSTGRTVAPGVMNALGDLGIRAAGGAITGGVSAGLVNPEDAGTGAAIGAVLPAAIRGAGAAGQAFGNVLRGPQQAPELTAAIQKARQAGYVIPPTQAKPTLGNRLLEGFAGKLTTAQNASAKNAQVTDRLIRTELGLADDAPLSIETLDKVRAEAGKAYGVISKLGDFDAAGVKLPDDVKVNRFTDSLMNRKETVDAGEVVRAWKQANHDATGYYRAYARDANPETLAKAKAASTKAKEIDDFLGQQLKKVGPDKLQKDLKDARTLIAKTYSVESALNPVTGTIDARKLAAQLEKGKPLSGGLKDAAEFAARFKTAAKTPESMGSLPQTSPLDWSLGMGMSAATMNPLAMAGVMARPAARSLALSPIVQNRLAQQAAQPNALAGLLANDDLAHLGYQSLPVLAASGR